MHHALSIEKRTVNRNGMLHDVEIALTLVVEHRHDDVLQFGVERFRVGAIIGDEVRSGATRFTDGPAGDTFDVPFRPPAVENAEAGHSIHSRLHATGSGSFQMEIAAC